IPNVIAMPLTVDKTLLVRAEAKVMLQEFESAASDLSLYYKSKRGQTATAQQISDFYDVPADYESLDEQVAEKYRAKLAGVAKPLHPKFTLTTGMQYNMIQAVLHARRVETLYEGDRWFDIKRYNIEITHDIPGDTPVVLKQDDLRHAMQLPGSVIDAGLPKNPR
ncbi:MAG: RagB/SusD family nutrient uptake outer membrane protein, partial [Porphyromonas sp.]|nr:RagB/SusD family nutrient uptake outer membrane protein [Porphyromonas sp.]